MKLLVADKLEDEALVALRALPGVDVVYAPTLAREALPGALDGVGILVVRSKEVGAKAIEAGAALDLIVRAGAGTNTIDVKAASARGIFVANCPGKNAIAVAELAIGLMLSVDRRIPDAVASLRAGQWEKGEFGKADGLYGKTLGLAGLGAIGREVLVRARALGMVPHAYSRSLDDERAQAMGVIRHTSLVDLARASQVLSVHLPLSPETRGAISAEVLGALAPRSVFVNTARAEVVDYAALAAAVRDRGLRVATDVFPGEPEGGKGTFQNELVGLAGVYGTPHVGASTAQAQLAIAAETVRIVRSFLERGEVPNCVNIAAAPPAKAQLVVRHYDRVGVLAMVLGVIKKHGINVGEMTNTLFAGGVAACAKIRLSDRPSPECIQEITLNPDVLYVEQVAL